MCGVPACGVRISAQLIDVRTDEHLWAENYDGDLTDIFSLQSTIAEEIVAALKATLTSEEKESIERLTTENTEAYDFYLKAPGLPFSIQREQRGSGTSRETLRTGDQAGPHFCACICAAIRPAQRVLLVCLGP